LFALSAQTEGKEVVIMDASALFCTTGSLHAFPRHCQWTPNTGQSAAAARKLADEMGLTLVRFQAMFDEAIKAAPPQYWAGDGVHPTLAGHALMAKTWREVVGI
jgi:hypothetical protein